MGFFLFFCGGPGGVTSMDSFFMTFFPAVYRKETSTDPSNNQYCKYDSQTLTLFTSSLYVAALVSSLVAGIISRKFGRRNTMLIGGVIFLAGAIFNGFAQAVWMLIVLAVYFLVLALVALIRFLNYSLIILFF